MIFNTPIFFLFFSIFLLLYGFIFHQHRAKILLILTGSLIFYGAWNYKFIPLLVGSGVADYFIAQAIYNAGANQQRKKMFVTLSLVINLGILGLFKYADFVLQSVADFLLVFGVEASLPTLSWVLPVGISFYTFQSLSYTIDVYRGDMKPRKGLTEFVAALSFFPQLVAGPILRARQILPQMHNLALPSWNDAKHGILLLTAGLIKKTGADLLAVPAQKAFEAQETISTLELWTGVIAFAGQIYGDFSGYTDMAIGIALLLGFKIPLNFRTPYFALSPVDFWRRWHISLSSWLRDYLYISLGGNRTGHRTRNVFITMLLGGLWHGAAWTFVAWGAFHGVIITATHYLGNLAVFKGFSDSEKPWARTLKWSITFYLILIGWVFFRAADIHTAMQMLANMHFLGESAEVGNHAVAVFWIVIVWTFLTHLMDYFILKGGETFVQKRWIYATLMILGVGISLFVGEPSNEFIYFQF